MSGEPDMEPTLPSSQAQLQEEEQIDNEKIVEQLAQDYAQYLTPPDVHSAPDVQALDDSIEELLTKLEEYCGLVDIVRSDTTLCLKRTLPEIKAKSAAMSDVFQRIDNMEVFVGLVKAQVATMEALMDQAEAELGSSTVKKFFNAMPSFFGRRKSQPQTQRQVSQFHPVEVFKTEDYFPKAQEEAEEVIEVVLSDGKVESVKVTKSEEADKKEETDNIAKEGNTEQKEEEKEKKDTATGETVGET